MTEPGRAAGTDATGLAALIRILRDAGFTVSASEASDATRLLIELARRDPEITEATRLRTRLRPVFCKSLEDQERFDAPFDRWLGLLAADTAKRAEPEVPAKHEDAPPGEHEEPPESGWQKLKRIAREAGPVALGVILIGGFIAYGILREPELPVPAPQLVLPQPADPQVQLAPSTDSSVRAKSQLNRFIPAARGNWELRAEWAWFLALLPLLAFIGVSLPALVLSRTKLRRNSEPMFLDTTDLAISARRLVPQMRPDIGDRLARHVYTTGLNMERLARRPVLDVRGTLEASARNSNVPTLRFSHSRVHPSYLLLIDVENEENPRGRLFFQWAERMQREGLDVSMNYIRSVTDADGAVSVMFRPTRVPRGLQKQWKPLARLRTPDFGQRLIVISDGSPLVDEDGIWHAAAARARLYRWRDRVMFTPTEPRDWSYREAGIERKERAADPGFIVLPLEESALGAWTDLVHSGRLSMVHLADPQRFPALLRGERAPEFESENGPEAADIELLMGQLRVYLGHIGFLWLAACAVPPLVRWELTLILGNAVLKTVPQLNNERVAAEALGSNYRRLVKLPWMQRKAMPDWLRLRLLTELSQSRQKELRSLMREQLALLPREAATEGVELEFERPPGNPHALENVTPEDSRDSGQPVSKGDALYLGYLSGLTPEQLVLRAPPEWAGWSQKLQLQRPSGLRGWAQRVRDHYNAFWARLAWKDGLPHLGISPRSLAVTAFLLVPLIAVVFYAWSEQNREASPPDNWLLAERSHAQVWRLTWPVHGMELSPDGSRVVVSGQRALQVWDASNGALLATRDFGIRGFLSRVHFSSDGGRIVGVTSNGELRVWDANTYEELTPRTSPDAVAQPDDGDFFVVSKVVNNLLIAASYGGSVRMWDIDTLTERERLAGPPRPRAIAATGERLIVFGEVAMEWDWVTGTSVATSLGKISGSAGFVDISPDGRSVAGLKLSGLETRELGLWRTDTGELVPLDPAAASSTLLARFTPDGSAMVTAGNDGSLWSVDPETGDPISGPIRTNLRDVAAFDISAGGTRIAVRSSDNMLQILNALPATRERTIALPGILSETSFSDDGRVFAALIDNVGITLWDSRSGKQLDTFAVGPGQSDFAAFALSYDGSRLATVSGDGTLRIEDVGTGRSKFRTSATDKTIFYSLALSPDGARLAVSGNNLTLWNANSGELISTIDFTSCERLQFDSSGRQIICIASAGSDYELQIRDGTTGQLIGSPLWRGKMDWADLSPDDTRAVISSEGQLFIWDMASRRQVSTLRTYHRGEMAAFFAENGSRIVSAGEDRTVSLWDAKALSAIGSPIVIPDISGFAVAPLGNRFVTATTAQTGENTVSNLVVWRTTPNAPATLDTSSETVEAAALEFLQRETVLALLLPAVLAALCLFLWLSRRRRLRLIARALAEGHAA